MNWDDRGQTKDSRLIASGVAATTGSVVEPYADPNRFTNSSVYVFQADGSTMGEAFAKSVATPDIQLFNGDLLAQPQADLPVITLNAAPAEGATVSGTIAIDAAATLSGAKIATGVAKLELLVDGKVKSTFSGSSNTFSFDTTTISDGRHELRIVATNNAAAESESYVLRNVYVNNRGRSVSANSSYVTINDTSATIVYATAVPGSGTVTQIQLRCLGRTLSAVPGNGYGLYLDGTMFAYGDNRVTPVAIFSDGTETAGTPFTVHRNPLVFPGQPLSSDLLPGLKAEYFLGKGGTSIAASDFSNTPDLAVSHTRINLQDGITTNLDQTTETMATTAIDKLAVRLSGRFIVPANNAGEYQFYFWKTNDSAEIYVDGQRLAGFNNSSGGTTTNQVPSIFLDPGEHDIEIFLANVRSSSTDDRFDVCVEYRGPDGITRVLDSSVTGFVNAAPVLDNSGNLRLTTIAEDATANPGMLVADMLTSAGGNPISDDDSGGSRGIAVTAADYAHGTWQYKIGSGSWTDLPRPSETGARLLPADNSTWIRFVPSVNWNGALSPAITFRAWDRSTGVPGGVGNASNNGGGTSYSSAVETATLTVTAVADPPSIINGAIDATAVADTGITPLRLYNLDLVSGGTDEQTQVLTITVTGVPNPARGSIVRAGDTVPLSVGQTLSEAELRGLRFMAAAGSGAASAAFSFRVIESGDGLLSDFTVPLDIVHRLPTSLLGDLETLPDSSDPANFVELGGIAYFTAADGAHGNELWRSDGTAAGTWMIRDVQPGSRGSSISGLVAVGGKVFFSANDGVNGQELWASDGTFEGTYLVKDLSTGSTSAGLMNGGSPGNLTNFNGLLAFTTNAGGLGTELWRSDGTADGTYMIKDVYAGSSSSSPARLTAVGGTLFFTATDGVNGTELWKTNGTAAGTQMVRDLTAGSTGSTFSATAAAGGYLYFVYTDAATGVELWRSDGTSGGTTIVQDIVAGSGSSSPANLLGIGNTLYFTAADSTAGTEVWKTNTATGATAMLADINPGTTGSSPTLLTNVNGTLFFRATDSQGAELWKSDGTTTVRVADIYSGSTGSTPSNLVAAGNTLFFTATTSAAGAELWKSDGTSGGTVLVKDLRPGTSGGSYASLATAGGRLFFRGSIDGNDRELWTSDGSTAGTVQVLDIATNTVSSNPNTFVAYNGKLYFLATTSTTGTELWMSDGTAAGTALLKDINAGTASPGITTLRVAGGKLYFNATNGSTGAELWSSDGTTAGTAMIKDINPGTTGSTPANFVDVGGTVYFTANDGTNGTELWKTDGTLAGTTLVKDITAGSASSTIANLTAMGTTLLFTCSDATNGTELWKSDGSDAGTVIVRDINPGTSSSSPASLTALGAYVFFAANDGTNGTELWRTDGTAIGTILLTNIYSGSGSSSPDQFVVMGGALYFAAADSTYGRELWRTIGTSYATRVSDIYADAASANPVGLTVIGSRVYFSAYTPTEGFELYSSDGTSVGTQRIADLRPGTAGSLPGNLTAVGNRLFFRANDGVAGPELWTVTGTSAPVLFADLVPGADDGYPQTLVAVGNQLFFRATNTLTGDEIWAWSDSAPTASTIPDQRMSTLVNPPQIALGQGFEDDIDLDAGLNYTVVGNSNPTLLPSTSIDPATGILTLYPAAGVVGTAQLTIQATDRNGQYAETSFNVSRAAPATGVTLDTLTPNTNGTLTATATPSDPDGDPVSLTFVWKVNGVERRRVTVTPATQDTFDLALPGNGSAGDAITVEVTPYDGVVNGTPASASATVATSASVAARRLFYNNSSFDGHNPLADAGDDNAIAAAKSALLPGATATPANHTNYAKGLNGVMIDVAGLPSGSGLSAADFTFKAGNTGNPAAWSAPTAAPSVTVRRGAGAGGTDRVELIWPDGALVHTWLQITILATASTGLDAADVFYFGNSVGDTTGDGLPSNPDLYETFLHNEQTTAVPANTDIDGSGVTTLQDIFIIFRQIGRSPTLIPLSPPATQGAGGAALLSAGPQAPLLDTQYAAYQALLKTFAATEVQATSQSSAAAPLAPAALAVDQVLTTSAPTSTDSATTATAGMSSSDGQTTRAAACDAILCSYGDLSSSISDSFDGNAPRVLGTRRATPAVWAARRPRV